MSDKSSAVCALDNIKIADLPILLHENTTLTRFFPLIPLREELCARLKAAGVADRAVLEACLAADAAALSEKTELPEEILRLTAALLACYRFRPRRFRELEIVTAEETAELTARGYRTTGEYLAAWEQGEANDERLAGLCDLMRLPGVKGVRAQLYYEAGLHTVESFAAASWNALQARLAGYLEHSGDKRAVPKPKELATQCAAARVLPSLMRLIR